MLGSSLGFVHSFCISDLLYYWTFTVLGNGRRRFFQSRACCGGVLHARA